MLVVMMNHFDAASAASNNASTSTAIPIITGVIRLGRREGEPGESCRTLPSVRRIEIPVPGMDALW